MRRAVLTEAAACLCLAVIVGLMVAAPASAGRPSAEDPAKATAVFAVG